MTNRRANFQVIKFSKKLMGIGRRYCISISSISERIWWPKVIPKSGEYFIGLKQIKQRNNVWGH